MEGNELFFEVQELPDDTDLICYVYTENGATYALQYEKLSRSEQSREEHNVYLVKRYPNQDKNVEEYADKGEFYDLREGDMIRVYYDGNAVHLVGAWILPKDPRCKIARHQNANQCAYGGHPCYCCSHVFLLVAWFTLFLLPSCRA